MSGKNSITELEIKIRELESRISELNENEFLYRSIFNKSPEVIVFVDAEGLISEVNHRVFDWIGYQPRDIIGKRFEELEFMDKETRELLAEKFAMRMDGKVVSPYTIEVYSKEGEKHYGQVVAQHLMDEKGKLMGSLTLISDITGQFQQTRMFKEASERSSALFEAIPDLVFIIDRNGSYVDFKADKDEVLVIPREEIIGKNIRESGFGEKYQNLIFSKIEETLKTGQVQTFEYELRTPRVNGFFECRMAALNQEEVLAIVRNITRYKQFKAELKIKNLVFESSLTANSTCDINGNILHVNKSFIEIWGYDRKEELEGMHISDLVVNKDDTLQAILTLNKTGEWRGEFVAKRKDGSTFISQGFSTVVCDESGEVIGYQTTNLDVSEQRKLEKARRDSEQRYRSLFEDNIDGVFIFDLNNIFLEVNNRGAEMLGYRPEEIVGKNISEFTSEKESQDSEKKIRALLAGEILSVYERTFVKKDGTEFPADVNVSLVYDSRGNPEHFQSIVRDVSKRKQSDLDIEKRQKYLESFLDAIPEAVITLDPSHKIVEWNPGAERMFGFAKGEVTGKDIDDLITRSNIINEAKEFTSKVLNGERIIPSETIRYRKDGTPVNVIVSGSPIKLKGKLQGVVAIYIDISMQKKIEEELNKADKLDSVALLAGGIAHDFNNILASISVNIGLLNIYKNDESVLKSKIGEIQSALSRATDLTQQLLTFSEGNAPIKNPASIENILRETVTFALSGSNVAAEFNISDSIWNVEIDEGQISQVIQNIVLNAVQAMPEGGRLKVNAENEKEENLRSLPLNKEHYIRIEFKDEGIGIPESHLKNIFDPFFTTKQKGGGLGLSTSFSIMKNHNGLITVESELGVSTSFFIYLPATDKKVGSKKKDPNEIISGTGRILLMDDDDMILDATGELLKHIGFKIEKVKTGEEAVELYKSRFRSPEAFDCVILDLTIPDGMGGKETILELLKIDPDVKAIASSGYSIDPIISDFKKFGFSGAIPKPYVISDLSILLNKVLKENVLK